jgi:hypothetical protein
MHTRIVLNDCAVYQSILNCTAQPTLIGELSNRVA